MKSWFGAEVQLGIIVLLVSVPIVGALIYVIAYGIIEDPFTLMPFVAGYALFALTSFGISRLPQGTRRWAERAYALLLGSILVGWCGWFMVLIWRDRGPLAVLTMLGMVAGLYMLGEFATRRAEQVDYHQR